jgi:hypothetical protein
MTAEGTVGAPTCLYSTHKKGRTGQVLSVDGREKRVDKRRGEGRWAYLEQKTKHGASLVWILCLMTGCSKTVVVHVKVCLVAGIILFLSDKTMCLNEARISECLNSSSCDTT